MRPAFMRTVAAGLALAFVIACGSATAPPSATGTTDPAVLLGNLVIDGDPSSPAGARWTYHEVAADATYDLSGILLKPAGNGPFPGVIVSHGAGGSAAGYSRSVGTVMRGWGLVVIAVDYTHAGGVPLGSPGTVAEPGASRANVMRARKTLAILSALPYVDRTRLAAHGNSMGAFVTTALLGAHPDLVMVASHTSGGVRTGGAVEAAAPVDSQTTAIRTPYQLHHGDADLVVPLAFDQRLAALLSARAVAQELRVYPGATHGDMALDATMLARVRAWYVAHGLMP